jgi:hypothetical protein
MGGFVSAISMKPRNAFIAGILISASVGILMAVFFGWDILRHFPSDNLVEPFHQRATQFNQPATNFVVFSSFVFQMAFDVTFFFVGIAVVVLAAFNAKKYLMRSASR